MTDIAASLGIEQLKKLNLLNSKRRELAQYFNENLAKYQDYFQLPKEPKGSFHSYFGYPILIKENTLWIKMPTPFASFLLAGFPLSAAGALHGFVMFGAVTIVAWVWYKGKPLPIRGSSLILGILLFTPYAFYYDLTLLALPLAWLGWDCFRGGWKLMEQSILIIIWLLPIIAPAIAIALGLQISPIFIAFLLFFTLRQSYKNNLLITS